MRYRELRARNPQISHPRCLQSPPRDYQPGAIGRTMACTVGRRAIDSPACSAVNHPERDPAGSALPPPFAGWFAGRGWEPHPHQLALLARAGDPATLLIAPTGGGKTLAGFLPSLVELGPRPAPGPAHDLRLPPEGAGGRHPPQPRRPGRRDGARGPRRGPHRRHRRRRPRPPAGRPAAHPADHARNRSR